LTHPILYVSGNTGVYRSLDGGQTWALFPSSASTLEASASNGGYLPNVKVTDLDLSIGDVNPTTGANVTQPGDSKPADGHHDGQGVFAIRLGPMVLPNTPQQPSCSGLDPSSYSGIVNSRRRHECGRPAHRRVHRAVDVGQHGVRQPLRHVHSEQPRVDRRL